MTACRIRLETSDGTAVTVQGNRIVSALSQSDVTVPLGDVRLSPGLINAHDHLHRNHFPRLGRGPYQNVYEWGNDIHTHDADRIAAARLLPRADALLFGAAKNLLSGVTVVVHHDKWESAFEQFPIHVPRVHCAHSLGLERERVFGSAPNGPLWLHLAEGTDPSSAEEVRILARAGRLHHDVVGIHVVGADAEGISLLRAARAGIVWCPTSNLFLYGQTAPEALLAFPDVMLGSDAMVSGEGTLLDELRVARSLGLMSEERLLAAVTTVPARRLNLVRTLAPDTRADFVAFRKPELEATVGDVALVIVDGVPRVADVEFADVFDACGETVVPVRISGGEKLMALTLAQSWQRALDAGADVERIVAAERTTHEPA